MLIIFFTELCGIRLFFLMYKLQITNDLRLYSCDGAYILQRLYFSTILIQFWHFVFTFSQYFCCVSCIQYLSLRWYAYRNEDSVNFPLIVLLRRSVYDMKHIAEWKLNETWFLLKKSFTWSWIVPHSLHITICYACSCILSGIRCFRGLYLEGLCYFYSVNSHDTKIGFYNQHRNLSTRAQL